LGRVSSWIRAKLLSLAIASLSFAIASAFGLAEYGRKDIGGWFLIVGGALAVFLVPMPVLAPPRRAVDSPSDRDGSASLVEMHGLDHVVHHHYQFSTITEGHEVTRQLTDGTIVRERLVRRWQ
jgi:hypothetical protein